MVFSIAKPSTKNMKLFRIQFAQANKFKSIEWHHFLAHANAISTYSYVKALPQLKDLVISREDFIEEIKNCQSCLKAKAHQNYKRQDMRTWGK